MQEKGQSCNKHSCAKRYPTIQSTHKLIIWAYHESQYQEPTTTNKHATTNQLNTQATTHHKCKSNTNQVSDHQSSKWPKSPLVNEPCAPIYPTQVQVWSSYETRDSRIDPQRSRQFVDPHPIHRPARLAVLKQMTWMWRKSGFQVLENPSRWGTVFVWSYYFLFFFLKWGKLSKNKNPLMTPVRKKWSVKLDF